MTYKKQLFNFNILNESAKLHLWNLIKDTDNIQKVSVNVSIGQIAKIAEQTLVQEETKENIHNDYLFTPKDNAKPNYKIDGNIIYVLPIAPEKLWLKFGPRQIKKVIEDYWWKYKIIFNNNSIDININTNSKYTYLKYINFTKPLINFIQQCNIQIDNLSYMYIYRKTTDAGYKGYVHVDPYPELLPINQVTGPIIFYSGLIPTNFNEIQNFQDLHIDKSFINNFPKHLSCEYEPYEDNINMVKLYKAFFNNDDNFYALAKKLIDLGYQLIDENKTVYNSKNIEILSNSEKNQDTIVTTISTDSKKEWLIDKLGEDYLEKFEFIRDTYFKKNPEYKHYYLVNFNKNFNKDEKRLSDSIILQLLDSNNIKYFDYWNNSLNRFKSELSDNEFNIDNLYALNNLNALSYWEDSDITYLIAKLCLYKMAFTLIIDQPNKFKPSYPNWTNFYTGYEDEFYTYGGIRTTFKIAGYNNIKLALDNIDDLYYLFYLHAYVINNILSFFHNIDIVYSEKQVYIIQNIFKNVEDKLYNEIDMNNFNFVPLISQFKKMIDNIYKKVVKNK